MKLKEQIRRLKELAESPLEPTTPTPVRELEFHLDSSRLLTIAKELPAVSPRPQPNMSLSPAIKGRAECLQLGALSDMMLSPRPRPIQPVLPKCWLAALRLRALANEAKELAGNPPKSRPLRKIGLPKTREAARRILWRLNQPEVVVELWEEEESFFDLPESLQNAWRLRWRIEGKLPGFKEIRPRRLRRISLSPSVLSCLERLKRAGEDETRGEAPRSIGFRYLDDEELKRVLQNMDRSRRRASFWERVRRQTGKGWVHVGKWTHDARRDPPHQWRVVRLKPDGLEEHFEQQELFEQRAGLEAANETVCPTWRPQEEHLWRLRRPEYVEMEQLLREDERRNEYTFLLKPWIGNPDLQRKFER